MKTPSSITSNEPITLSRALVAGGGVLKMAHDPGVNISDVCGASWWGIIHGVAKSIRDHGCASCGEHAMTLMEYAHDLVNVSLGKRAERPEAIRAWTPFALQLATRETAQVAQAQRRHPKCKFDATTFASNPGAVSRFMRELKKHQSKGDAGSFVAELNALCGTVQPRLPLSQDEPKVKISGKCSNGSEGACELKAVSSGKMERVIPRIDVPITDVSSKGISSAVREVREQLAAETDALEKKKRGSSRDPVVSALRKELAAAMKPRIRSSTDADTKTFAQLDGDRIDLDLSVVPLDAVIPSNDPENFQINSDYPGWLQPRDRGRAANVAQVRSMAANLDPERLIEEFHTLEGGPPVVWEDTPSEPPFSPIRYMVVSGNGRAMAIKLAFTDYPDEYNAYLRAVEKAMGWKAGLLGGSAMSKTPSGFMLIRVLDRGLTQERVREIAELGNVAKAIATSSVEQAAIDSGKMSSQFVSRLLAMDDPTASLEQTISAAKNRQWVVEFMRSVPNTQAASMTDQNGRLSESGVRRIVMALAMWTFGVDEGNKIGELAFESTDHPARNVVLGVLRSVPELAAMVSRLNGYVDASSPETRKRAIKYREDYNILPHLGSAILAYAEIKRVPGMTVETRLQQAGMGGFGTDFSPVIKTLLLSFEKNRRSARAVSEALDSYAEQVNTLPDPNQAEMFPSGGLLDAHRPTMSELISRSTEHPAIAGGQGRLIELSKRLTTKERKRLPRSAFACPNERAYPINDASHVRAAIGRYQQKNTLKCDGAEKRICSAAKKHKIHAEVCTL